LRIEIDDDLAPALIWMLQQHVIGRTFLNRPDRALREQLAARAIGAFDDFRFAVQRSVGIKLDLELRMGALACTMALMISGPVVSGMVSCAIAGAARHTRPMAACRKRFDLI